MVQAFGMRTRILHPHACCKATSCCLPPHPQRELRHPSRLDAYALPHPGSGALHQQAQRQQQAPLPSPAAEARYQGW